MLAKKEEWVLAPMDSFTDHRFRTAYAKNFKGLDWAVSPFITLVEGRKVKLSHLKDIWRENNPLMEVEPQFLGADKSLFQTMAEAVAELGYTSLNWNIGCPMPNIVRKGRGSGILPYPERIREFLEKAFSCTPIDLSVKLRLGYYEKEEFFRVVEVLNDFPLKYVALHPRLGIQRYQGRVDLDFFEEIYPLIKAPCIYNGDILSVEAAQSIRQRFPFLRYFMMGRGVLGNPFLPEEIGGRKFSREEKTEMLLAFMDDLQQEYQKEGSQDSMILHRMKQYWSCFEIQEIPSIFEKMKQVQQLEEYRQICQSIRNN